MSDQAIEYAPGNLSPVHSRAGLVAFACSTLAIGGIVITMFLIMRPIPGPTGARVREMAPLFGILVALLWLAGLVLGVIGNRQRQHIRTFARAALATCGAMAGLFVAMIVFLY